MLPPPLPPQPDSHPFSSPRTLTHSHTRHRRLLHHLIFHHQLVLHAYKWPRRMRIEPRSSNLDQCQPQRTRDAWRNLMPAGSQSRRPPGFCSLSVKPIPFLFFLSRHFRLFWTNARFSRARLQRRWSCAEKAPTGVWETSHICHNKPLEFMFSLQSHSSFVSATSLWLTVAMR